MAGSRMKEHFTDPKFVWGVVVTLIVVGIAWGTSQADIRTLREKLEELKPLPTMISRLETTIAVLNERVDQLNRRLGDPRRDYP